ncbi:MAG: putative acyl carrier protein [Moraxellaceae bacterium]|jgi:acyl carrier protein|nr:putative acyl carrier protein [Moraxellaceae bacterium]
MNIEALINKIREELDDLDLAHLEPDTVLREIEGWSSLYGLILMALVSTEYNVDLSGQQIQRIRTVRDLYDAIQKNG